jgi:predicted kinase
MAQNEKHIYQLLNKKSCAVINIFSLDAKNDEKAIELAKEYYGAEQYEKIKDVLALVYVGKNIIC